MKKFTLWIGISIFALLFSNCSALPPNRAKAISDMQEAKHIHELWLAAPENPERGNHAWHRLWVENYKNCIKVLKEK